ncbi:MAG: NAD(P)H-quinone oxidoreductase [Sphingomonadales bacterium]|nr:MAG: NAD(P)H-quinone oxidoreductase [Sphingomonadales bacterium]TNF03857.1 MAG: NAD(P)H-quinone oxidoreductase [Sphingomonadales bacterium]
MTLEVISKEMRAVGFDSPGGPDVLTERMMDIPAPGEGDVLIRVLAAGVNRPDALQRAGKYPPPPGASPLPGLEVSGIVVQVGRKVAPDLMGQKVCALANGGGYAEYVVVPAGQCLPVPDGYDMVEAAALPETLFTVWTNLFERAYAVEGDTVLVHGGTSGIGTMAISLCRLFGVKIIVTCGSDDKCKAARDWGATHAINYRTQDFVAEVRELTEGRRCQAVLDMVGGDYVQRNLRCLADDGRHVSIAVLGGSRAEISIAEVMGRRLTLTGSTLRPRSATFKALVADEISAHVWPFVKSGQLRPAMDRIYPLEQAAAAHARMEAGDHFGKIVLKVGEEG